jgi:hypothetical protein
MTIEKINFVLELTKKQLKFVRNSDNPQSNQIASGLFNNDEFVEILMQIGGPDFFSETKKDWKKDDHNALIFDLELIITSIEKLRDENLLQY